MRFDTNLINILYHNYFVPYGIMFTFVTKKIKQKRFVFIFTAIINKSIMDQYYIILIFIEKQYFSIYNDCLLVL